jgi:hypothetical protein
MRPKAFVASSIAMMVISIGAASAANPTIGVATAIGAFSLDNAPVTGNADIVDGAELRTTTAPSDVRLQNDTRLRLATRSMGAIFADHAVLKEGALRVSNFDNYRVEARHFQVEAGDSETEAIVRVTGKTVEVASIGGPVRVTDGGAMLTRVAAGTRMAFRDGGQNSGAKAGQSQSGATAQTGAAPAEKGPISDKKAILWAAGICAVGAIVVGSIAASQGKSPF